MHNHQPPHSTPYRRPSPGRILRRELDAREMTQKDLAKLMGRPEKTISMIVQGHKRITAQTALELEAALGVSAEMWVSLEANYRLALARVKREGELSELRGDVRAAVGG